VLANTGDFTLNGSGRHFRCRNFRQPKGVEDKRGHGQWLLDDWRHNGRRDRIPIRQKHVKDECQKTCQSMIESGLLEGHDGDGKETRR